MSTTTATSGCGADTKVEKTLQGSEVKSEGIQETTGEKRKLEGEEVTTSVKKEKTDQAPVTETETAPLKRRKVALFMSYSGKGYFGLQRQKDFPTIEGALGKALLSVGVISKQDEEMPQKMEFQRAARTDKGVSAAGNLISLKIPCIRVTKAFNSKNYCDGRTYSYLTPTLVFAPHTQAVTEKYRVQDETLEQVREIIKRFEGTHNFHNFTSGLKPTEAKAKRYIINFKCGEPFVQDDMEFVQLTVRGQSFMLHHIRKMIGLTIAIVRGCCGEEVIEKSYSVVKVDIPKAPGNGLMLEELHYHHYNRRYGTDGIHEALDWTIYKEAIDKFKEEHIYPEMIRSEKVDQSMVTWLATLDHHEYDEIPPEKLLNWKFKESDENNKKGKSTSSSEKPDCTGETTSDNTSSSTENGKEDVLDQAKTKNAVDSPDNRSVESKNMMVSSAEDVPSSCNKDKDVPTSCNKDTDKSADEAVNDKETVNKMEVS
ncbi:tRNA pseudouridine synthase A, mitochondrial [Mizuhopecten yessoensis]|uniref:Pseudouridylate synthase 1 homolog n=1 Tax=Mizuhopecten yessoensis TaxID=6573 RepID=A0A210PP61_MIZYE|nr:tRNA pseudouridine synthase A, mitochondrial [Mizuhopecten yessoensis]